MMEIKIKNSLDEIPKEAWETLLAQSPTNTVFQTYEWHQAWLKNFGSENEPFFVCVEENSVLIGIAPLVIKNHDRRNRILRFAGHGLSDYCDFLYHKGNEEVLKAVLMTICDRAGQWERIELANVPGDSVSNKVLREFFKASHVPFLQSSTQCPAPAIKEDPDFFKEVKGKKHLIRKRNSLFKKGGYEVEHLKEKEQVLRSLELLFDQHIRRWEGSGTPSLFADQRCKDLYRDLVERMAEKGWIVLSVVRSGQLPAAYHFGFAYRNIFGYYKSSFEVSLSSYSPSLVLLKELLDYVDRNAFDEFDFMWGEEQYKQRFTNVNRENFFYLIYRNRLRHFARALIRFVKKLFKK